MLDSTLRTSTLLSVLTGVLLLSAPGARSVPPQEHHSRTDEDQEALWRFEPFLGTWAGEEPGTEVEIAWGIEGKSLFIRHLRVEGEERTCMAEAMVGWHYGERRLVFHEFVRDARSFEVMSSGAFYPEAEGVLRRELHAFDPDGSSREYREWYVPGDGGWKHRIEYRDDDGTWKAWRTFAFRPRT